ncbi:hypothetical protein KAI92_01010 [Candidatus Parcubacteria bacterium]|nr:hypothetical protein [Candidatus Parcubacteria bacterium]
MKKFIASILTLMLIVPAIVPLTGLNAADGQVCGTDGITYVSTDAAGTAEVDVSYNFACTNPTSEDGLFEATTDIAFAGMLIEIGSTDLPTTVIIRDNETKHDYTVELDSETDLNGTVLSDWIPGDQIKVKGAKNENTENIETESLENVSISLRNNNGINGWITNISTSSKEITYQWANIEHTFSYTDDTRFVVGGINPASANDLKVNDRIRGRLVNSEAKIVVVLRRGENLFMKIRTFRPNAELVALDTTVVPAALEVKILPTPGLKSGDVNNLISGDGALVTVYVNENTKIVRKYFGETKLEEFSVGDKLKIVGRVNDNGSIDAKLLKNDSIWQTALKAHAGVVTDVNENENYIMVNWTPIKHITKEQLKIKLNSDDTTDDTTVTAQMVETDPDLSTEATPTLYQVNKISLRDRIKNKVLSFKEEIIGTIKRKLKVREIAIERISHQNIKIKDLIQRMPTKKMKVEISDETTIIIGTNQNATISDIKNGDKVRVRGTRHVDLPLINAETIVVVSALPEIEEDEEALINDVNSTAEVIVTDEEETDVDTDVDEDTDDDTDTNDDNDAENDGSIDDGTDNETSNE